MVSQPNPSLNKHKQTNLEAQTYNTNPTRSILSFARTALFSDGNLAVGIGWIHFLFCYSQIWDTYLQHCDMDKMDNELNIFAVSDKKNYLIKLKESNKSNEFIKLIKLNKFDS